MDSNEELAVAYLEGRWKHAGKRRKWETLPAGSREERRARIALARLLRGETPLKPSIRWMLASLVDDRREPYQTRQFRIVARPGLARTAVARDVAIARHIGENGGTDGAMKDASQIFGVSVRQTLRAWKKYRRVFEK